MLANIRRLVKGCQRPLEHRPSPGLPWRPWPPKPASSAAPSIPGSPSTGRGDHPALASCAVQRTLCTDFIRSMAGNGWYPITEPFDDEGFSGATVQRPALERLFARLQDGDIHRLVVYRLDRFTRSVSDWAHLAQRLERFDVGLTVVRGAIDAGAGALANLQLNVLASFAELERSMIHERLSDARAAHQARGERFAGRVPLGYAPDPRTKQLVVVEAEAATVRQLFTEAATGVPASTLCANANALGLPGKNGKRGHWDARALLRLLQNPVYAGRRPDGSPGVHAPIIDDESFDKVQAIIASRRTRSPSKRTTVDPRIDPFILRGLLACEACGKTMTTSMSTALTKKSAVRAPRYYRCRTPGCTGGRWPPQRRRPWPTAHFDGRGLFGRPRFENEWSCSGRCGATSGSAIVAWPWPASSSR